MEEKNITILKAESRPYKTKAGEDAFFNSVSCLVDGDLFEMSCSKELADYVIKNFEKLKGSVVLGSLRARGYELVQIEK